MVPKKKRKHRDLLCWAPLKMVERDSMLNQTYRLNSLTTWSPEALICLGTRNFFGKTRTSIEALRLQVIRREQRYIEERWVFAGGGRGQVAVGESSRSNARKRDVRSTVRLKESRNKRTGRARREGERENEELGGGRPGGGLGCTARWVRRPS
ncbi:hypothetical protein RUM44_000413 [Polyplax serrata]|uniref:Uncharacterized protein n=1 Tax=Polyplax serrata TaxID=468196 RepID=A0ABR1B5F4_POLSC